MSALDPKRTCVTIENSRVFLRPQRSVSPASASVGEEQKRTFRQRMALPLPPGQRSFAFQDLVAHPSLRGIVMRTLVPHYVRLDRHPHWKPYHGQRMLDAKQTSHVVACHKQQVAICEKGRHG